MMLKLTSSVQSRSNCTLSFLTPSMPGENNSHTPGEYGGEYGQPPIICHMGQGGQREVVAPREVLQGPEMLTFVGI